MPAKEPPYTVKPAKILCFLDLLPFPLQKVTTSSVSKMVALLWDQLGQQYVARIELGFSSSELAAATVWAGVVEVSLNRQ